MRGSWKDWTSRSRSVKGVMRALSSGGKRGGDAVDADVDTVAAAMAVCRCWPGFGVVSERKEAKSRLRLWRRLP